MEELSESITSSCNEWFVMFDHFCLDLVGLVLSEFVWSVSFGLSQTERKKK